jgi:hypothetical protein
MRFKDFLREAKHRQDISVEKARELIEANCKDMDIRRPFWRGSRKTEEEAYIIQGELGGRSSANTTNHYTVVMDEFLPSQGYPARSKSIIMASPDNQDYALSYGKVYAIIPFDGVKIGVTSDEDIWHTRIKIGKSTSQSLSSWNEIFSDADIPDYSFEDMVNGIEETMQDYEDPNSELFSHIFGGLDVAKALQEAYSETNMRLRLTTTARPPNGPHECWVSGKCVALRLDVWKQLMGEMK